MNFVARILALFSLSAVLLFAYTNCGQVSENDLFNGKFLCPEGSSCSNGPQGKMITSFANPQGVVMTCQHDQLQLGGACSPGNNTKNLIQYWIERGGNKISWGASGETPSAVANDVVCENGRFSMTLRRPNDSQINYSDSGCTSNSCTLDYALKFQIFSYNPDKTSVASTPGTFNFKVEWCGSATPAIPRAPQQKALASLGPAGKRLVSFCKGSGTTLAQLGCGSVLSGYAAPTVSWTASSDVKAFSGSIKYACPGSSTALGKCEVDEACAAITTVVTGVPYCSQFRVACDLSCFEP